MNSSPYLLYALFSREHYENIDQYQPTPEYRKIIANELGASWECVANGFWTNAVPPAWHGVTYGWKIHLSTTQENAEETLIRIAPVLKKSAVAFKFCSDSHMLMLSLSKAWPRVQSGKFVTIYPRSTEEFKQLCQDLSKATANLNGPHILTDRAFPGSTVVYYRYGAHAKFSKVDPYGNHTSGYYLRNGEWAEDIRSPRFSLPQGIEDPFQTSTPVSTPKRPNVLLADRYDVRGALKFNGTGGIYHGIDTSTGGAVVLREARSLLGHMESEMPHDPAYILKREASILQKLSATGLVPKYVDLFKEWNNWFLVVERLDAVSLWGQSMEFYFENEDKSSGMGLAGITSTIRKLAVALRTIHSHGVVLRDLTRNNVMFSNEDGAVKFIDLEFAYEPDQGGPWLRGWTPGYASEEQSQNESPRYSDDLYAFGALIIDMITFCAAGMELDRTAIMRKLRLVLSDLGLPDVLLSIAEGLTKSDPAARMTLDSVVSSLDEIIEPSTTRRLLPARTDLMNISEPSDELMASARAVERGLRSYIKAQTSTDRSDRLWPASPEIFLTNPLSMQYGAVGTAWYLLRSSGRVDAEVLDWIEARASLPDLPLGLYSGKCGAAVLLASAGRFDSACHLVSNIDVEQLTHPGLYFGRAGWGFTCLHLWSLTGSDRFLDLACVAADRLIRSAQEEESGICWPYKGETYLGLGDGQAGVSLFLTYVAAASERSTYLEAAERSLRFDIAHSRRVAGRLVWTTHVAESDKLSKLPHTRFGSAGIGSACIRLYSATKNSYYLDVALDCAHTVRSRMSNKIWQDEGAAGFGEFFLDLGMFLSDVRFSHLAAYQAEAILTHALERPEGFAFAGIDHYRICCDYAAGGAGIGVFLDRLINGKDRLLSLDFLLTRNADSPVYKRVPLGGSESHTGAFGNSPLLTA